MNKSNAERVIALASKKQLSEEEELVMTHLIAECVLQYIEDTANDGLRKWFEEVTKCAQKN